MPGHLEDLIVLPGLDGMGKWLGDFVRLLPTSIRCRVLRYPPDLPLGYEALIERVRAELPREAPYALLAESFSGPIGIRIAADPPPGLQALVLCGTFASNPFPYLQWARAVAVHAPLKSMPRWMRRLLMWGRGTGRPVPRQRERGLAMVDRRVVRARIGAIFDVDVSDELMKIRLPVLVMRATRDRVVSQRATAEMLARLASARLLDIDGPHLLLQARPAQCAAAVAQFLQSAGPERPGAQLPGRDQPL